MPRFLAPTTADDSLLPVLVSLQRRIEASSNFRFAWQFFDFSGIDASNAQGARWVLETMVCEAPCCQFLRSTFEAMYDDHFEVSRIHPHCRVVQAAGELEGTLAAAAGDHLGAYSATLGPPTRTEVAEVERLFGSLGSYEAFQLLSGSRSDCRVCAGSSGHLFSTWFFGVAWDWCFLVTWPQLGRAWVGCLTDTD